MGYLRDPATGVMVRQTTVTGTIHATCGCRIPYDDTDMIHRRVRLANGRSVNCAEHGWEMVTGGAYTGPAELLWPDPVERREALDDIARDHETQWWELEDVDATDVAEVQ